MCAKFRFSISSRCDDIVAEVKGATMYMPPPPAAGGWRGGQVAAGLIKKMLKKCFPVGDQFPFTVRSFILSNSYLSKE